jgi:biopolymer transport protein ExbD
MSGSVASTESCEPNLVPILDMVFQLITFFMLVVNFKATEVDLDLNLPVVGSAQPVLEDEKHRDLLVLNVRANGELAVRGQVQPNADVFIQLEAKTVASQHGLELGSPLPVTVVIRADRSVEVKSLMKVVDSCRSQGFDKFDFVIVRAAGKS